VNANPLWVPLLVAVIALLGTFGATIGGVIITQRHSDRREAVASERERQREREHWAREDALRNFEARRDSYIAFYESLREMARTAYDYGMGLSKDPPSEGDAGEDLGIVRFEWHTPTFRRHEHLRVFASPEVLAAADDAYSACWQWGNYTRWGQDDTTFYVRQDQYNDAELTFYDAMRRDLGLTGVIENGRPVPGSGWATDEPAARESPVPVAEETSKQDD
jgi:hypothetical protein